MNSALSFGKLVKKLRKEKKWIVKEFIKRLDVRVSHAYITLIELHGEIPSPELMLKIAEVFEYDEKELLQCAKTIKVRKFKDSLDKRYQQAVEFYSTQKKKFRKK